MFLFAYARYKHIQFEENMYWFSQKFEESLIKTASLLEFQNVSYYKCKIGNGKKWS